MEKLIQLETQYVTNPQIEMVINNKFIKRNILWNYLKKNNQVQYLNWQTVKFDELKETLISFWRKRIILNKDLTVPEICLLLSMKQHFKLIEYEISDLKERLNFKLQFIIDNIMNFHVIILKHHIQVINGIDHQGIHEKSDVIRRYLKNQERILLRKMISTKVCTQNEKERYLQLKNVDVIVDDDHANRKQQLNQTFNNVFQADRNKYILENIKKQSISLYNK